MTRKNESKSVKRLGKKRNNVKLGSRMSSNLIQTGGCLAPNPVFPGPGGIDDIDC